MLLYIQPCIMYTKYLVLTFLHLNTGDDVLSLTTCAASWRFRFEDKENLHRWLIHLIQHAADHRRWKQVAEKR